MKNTIKFLGIIAMVAVITVGAFAQQYDPESDFQVAKSGNSIGIIKYVGKNTVVKIPATIQGRPVTGILDRAFQDMTSLTGITIPNTVTSIQSQAFIGCTSLTSITIPNSVKTIGANAFKNCTSLTSVTFEGTIAAERFNNMVFSWDVLDARNRKGTRNSDLRDKYLAGGPGTYTRPDGNSITWTKK